MDIEHIKDLTPDKRNARRHNPRNIGMIVDSLHEVGAARSIVIDENGRILAGNGTVDAAAEAGIEKVRVVDVDGETIVAVRRTGLTEDQKTRLALLDNRSAETAEWDAVVLAAMAEDGVKLDDLFADDELTAILGAVPIEEGDGGDEFDTTPDDGPTTVQAGEVWALGRHRLMCGDSTKAEDVARLMDGAMPNLMITDPPYGVDYDPNWRNEAADKGLISHAARRVGNVTNDDNADWRAAYALFTGNVAYVWYADRMASVSHEGLTDAGFEIRNQIIWAKSRFAISRGHYNAKHEPCLYAVRKGATANWIGDHSQTTLWDINMDKNVDGGHSTQKPLECMARPIRNHSGDVYDPFLGSGTTVIAAHRLNRVCYGMEIEPKYCDVIIRRYKAETGEGAVRVYPDAA